jgi:chromosome segregation ATPase
LEFELKNANSLLSTHARDAEADPSLLYPKAARLGAKIHAGKSLTEIYSELCVSEDRRTTAEAKAERAEEDLQTILHEIEERAPAIMRQREDLEDARRRVGDLTARLQQANAECRGQDATIRKQQGTIAMVQRHNRTLETSVEDLSKQV